MPRTLSDIGAIHGPGRVQHGHGGDARVALLNETIVAHARAAWMFPVPLRRRLIDFAGEGERGPPP